MEFRKLIEGQPLVPEVQRCPPAGRARRTPPRSQPVPCLLGRPHPSTPRATAGKRQRNPGGPGRRNRPALRRPGSRKMAPPETSAPTELKYRPRSRSSPPRPVPHLHPVYVPGNGQWPPQRGAVGRARRANPDRNPRRNPVAVRSAPLRRVCVQPSVKVSERPSSGRPGRIPSAGPPFSPRQPRTACGPPSVLKALCSRPRASRSAPALLCWIQGALRGVSSAFDSASPRCPQRSLWCQLLPLACLPSRPLRSWREAAFDSPFHRPGSIVARSSAAPHLHGADPRGTRRRDLPQAVPRGHPVLAFHRARFEIS